MKNWLEIKSFLAKTAQFTWNNYTQQGEADHFIGSSIQFNPFHFIIKTFSLGLVQLLEVRHILDHKSLENYEKVFWLKFTQNLAEIYSKFNCRKIYSISWKFKIKEKFCSKLFKIQIYFKNYFKKYNKLCNTLHLVEYTLFLQIML